MTANRHPLGSSYLRADRRTLEQYLDELLLQLKALPLASIARPQLVSRIRQVEHLIDSRSGLDA